MNVRLVCLALSLSACIAADAAERVSFMTFNIWGDYFGNPPEERDEKEAGVIVRWQPDVVAFQEVTPNFWKSRLFPSLEKAGYAVLRPEDGHVNHVPLAYRRDRFACEGSGYEIFHLKLTDNKGITWAVLRDLRDGRRFIAFSTHFWYKENGEESDAIRELNARHCIGLFARIKALFGDLPVVGGGDLNSLVGSIAHETFNRAGYRNAQEVAADADTISSWHMDPVRDEKGVYRGFLRKTDNTSATSLDHVFVEASRVKVLRHRVVRDQDALDVSDHSPVVATLVFTPESAGDGAFINHVHRGGGAATRPDNTLETFVWAWEHGVGVECDCRLTKDGVAVMLHDETLRRTGRHAPAEILTNRVADLTYAQIKDVDVGSYLDSKFADERVPTLEQVLSELKKDPRRTLFVDDKGIGPERLMNAAKVSGTLDQVWYTTCSHDAIIKWHRMTGGGKSRLWWVPGTREHTPEALAKAEANYEKVMRTLREKDYEGVTLVCFDVHYNPAFADPFVPSSAYLRKLAEEFRRADVRFTCVPYEGGDRPESYEALRKLGVEGFSTDNPETLFEVLGRHGNAN